MNNIKKYLIVFCSILLLTACSGDPDFIRKDDCITEGCPENYSCCAGCMPAMCTKTDINSYVTLNDTFKSIKQTNKTVRSFADRLTFEDIPNGSTFCVPKSEREESCHWVEGLDGKFREVCYDNLIYTEVCYEKD